MTIDNKYTESRDDQEWVRLYFLLQYHYQRPERLKKIKSNVYYVKFPSTPPAVIKSFTSYGKLQRQQILTDYLVSEGFPTYSFIKEYGVIYNQSRYYTMISFLEAGKPHFSYKNMEDCTSGLQLLEQYHNATRNFPRKDIFPKFNQYQKWEIRFKEFQSNLPILKSIARISLVVNQFIDIAQWSLEKMKKYQYFSDLESPVITHGDVAHHNFFRTKDDQLYLIDFDLAAVAPRIVDYLQYAQRLMSYKGDIQEILKMPGIQSFSKNPWFLAALAYPSELFRETNRITRHINENNNSISLHRLERMWLQYNLRQPTFSQLKEIVK